MFTDKIIIYCSGRKSKKLKWNPNIFVEKPILHFKNQESNQIGKLQFEDLQHSQIPSPRGKGDHREAVV